MKISKHYSIELVNHKLFLVNEYSRVSIRISKENLIKLQELITECLKHPNNNP